MQPILSLCIPTYNRSLLLQEALLAIAAQWEDTFTSQIEINISDNASTDDTPQVLRQFAAAHPQITLHSVRSPENRGPDANIYQAVQMSQGTFVYILSDDDILLPGAVRKLLILIKTFPTLDGFSLNIRSFRHTPEECTPSWLSVTKDTVIQDRNEALHQLNLLFLSVFAFRRSLIAAKDYQKWIGTNLLQSYLFLDVLTHDQGILVTTRPYLAQRQENTSGWNFFRVMTINTRDWLTQAEEMGFSHAAVSAWLAQHLRKQIMSSVLHFKLNGCRSKLAPETRAYGEAMSWLRQIYGFDPFLWCVLFPLMLMPERMLQGLRTMSHLLRIRHPQIDRP